MGLSTYFLIICLVCLVKSFNIDLGSPYLFRPEDPNAKDTYFGYSVAIADATLYVGSPKYLNTETNKRTGAFELCYITKTGNVCEKQDTLAPGTSEVTDNQMLGASVSALGKFVLACAPGFSKTQASYGTVQIGSCDLVNTKYTSSNIKQLQPCNKNLVDTQAAEFLECSAGFSSGLVDTDPDDKVTEEKDLKVVFGAPILQIGRGYLYYGKNSPKLTKPLTSKVGNLSENLGYSLTTGLSQGKRSLIGGAPRSDELKGEVFVFDGSSNDLPITADVKIPKDSEYQRLGSYFGGSVAYADLNGDSYMDLIVGAPRFPGKKTKKNSFDQGAVFIYIYQKEGDGGSYKHNLTLYGDEQDGALFGYSVTNCGDLNGDNFDDIAVGAPWGGASNKGKVFLYYGGVSMTSKAAQVLEPSSFTGKAANETAKMDGFGFSLAGNKDFDGNKYPDIAVGSYRSQHAIVLRSRPVAIVVATIELPPGSERINLDDKSVMCPTSLNGKNKGNSFKCIKAEVCFTVTGKNLDKITKHEIELTFEVDAGTKEAAAARAFVESADGTEEKAVDVRNITVDKKNPRHCEKYTVFLKSDVADIFNALKFKASTKYKEANPCVVCVMGSSLLGATVKELVYTSCKAGDCKSDLGVKVNYITNPDAAKIIQLGVTNTIQLTVEVENFGAENAYKNALKIIYPAEIDPRKVEIEDYPGTPVWEPNSSQDSDVKTLQVMLSQKIPSKQKEVVIVYLGLLEKKLSKKTVDMTISVESTFSKDTNQANDQKIIKIPVTKIANLTVSGSVAPSAIKWKLGQNDYSVPGPLVQHRFLFQNQGPANVPESDVEIYYPEQFNGKYFLNLFSVVLESPDGKGECKPGELNPAKLDNITVVNTVRSSNRRRRSVEGNKLDCDSSTCRTIKCSLKNLDAASSATLTLKATLQEAVFELDITQSRTIYVKAKFTTSVVEPPPSNPAPDTFTTDISIQTPYSKKTVEGGGIPWWVILVSVLAAILIIGIIVFIMYKKGFFKRKQLDQMQDDENDALKDDED